MVRRISKDAWIPLADISSQSNLRSAQRWRRGDMDVPRTRTINSLVVGAFALQHQSSGMSFLSLPPLNIHLSRTLELGWKPVSSTKPIVRHPLRTFFYFKSVLYSLTYLLRSGRSRTRVSGAVQVTDKGLSGEQTFPPLPLRSRSAPTPLPLRSHAVLYKIKPNYCRTSGIGLWLIQRLASGDWAIIVNWSCLV